MFPLLPDRPTLSRCRGYPICSRPTLSRGRRGFLPLIEWPIPWWGLPPESCAKLLPGMRQCFSFTRLPPALPEGGRLAPRRAVRPTGCLPPNSHGVRARTAARRQALCTSQLEMHLAIDAGMGGFGLSHDSFGARMGGTPERLYKCTQENLQVSSTTRPCLTQTGAGWCLTPEEGRVAESLVDAEEQVSIGLMGQRARGASRGARRARRPGGRGETGKGLTRTATGCRAQEHVGGASPLKSSARPPCSP